MNNQKDIDEEDEDIEEDEEEENEIADECNDFDDDEDDLGDEMIFEFENVEKAEEKSPKIIEHVNISLEEVVHNFDQIFFFESIKLLCDWLLVNDEIVRLNIKSPLWGYGFQ